MNRLKAFLHRCGFLTLLLAIPILLAGAFFVQATSDGTDAEGHIVSFTASGQGYDEDGVYKIGIGYILFLKATCDCADDPNHKITIKGPGWSPNTSEPGKTSHPIYGPCNSAGEFTCEATCTSGGHKALQVKVFEIESFAIEKSDVCAGAVDSEVHKSNVEVQVYPHASFKQVRIEMTGGGGYTDGEHTEPIRGTDWTVTYGSDQRRGAELTIGGVTRIGVPEGFVGALIATDGTGKAEGTIISSNLIDDKATIAAIIGPKNDSMMSDTIMFGEPELEVKLPERLAHAFEVRCFLNYGGKAVDGHAIEIYVSDVKVPKGRSRRWIRVPCQQWNGYVKHRHHSGQTDPEGLAEVPTGLRFPPGFEGVWVQYSAYDMSAFKEIGSVRALAVGFLREWVRSAVGI